MTDKITLPHAPITVIPDTNPAATPTLWNYRYAQIDDNFEAVRSAVLALQETMTDPDLVEYFDEIYGVSSGDIIGEIVVSVSALSPDPVDTFEEALE